MVKKKKISRPSYVYKVRNNDWAALIRDLRVTLVNSVKEDCELKDHIEVYATQTDTFHPLDTEDAMTYELPHDFFTNKKEAEEVVVAYLNDFIEEMQGNVREYYKEPWNFAPENEYFAETEIEFKEVSVKHMIKHFDFNKQDVKEKRDA